MDFDGHMIRRQAQSRSDLRVGQVLEKFHVDDRVFIFIQLAHRIVQLFMRLRLCQALLRRSFTIHKTGTNLAIDPFILFSVAKVASQFTSHDCPEPGGMRSLALLKLTDHQREYLGGDRLGQFGVTGAGDDITTHARRVAVEQSLDLSPNIADNTPPAAPRGVLSR